MKICEEVEPLSVFRGGREVKCQLYSEELKGRRNITWKFLIPILKLKRVGGDAGRCG